MKVINKIRKSDHVVSHTLVLCIIILLSLLIQPIWSNNKSISVTIKPELWLYHDKSGQLSIADIRKQPNQYKFEKSEQEMPSLGVLSYPLWVRFTLPSNLGTNTQLILSNEMPTLDSIHIYTYQNGKLIQRIAGRMIPATQWEYLDRNPTVHLDYTANSDNTYYMKIQSDVGIILSVVVRNEFAYDRHQREDNLIQGFYFGWVVAMILYNLFLFGITKEVGYLTYSLLLIFANFLFQASLNGFLPLFLFSENPTPIHNTHNFVYLLSLILASLLAIDILKTKQNHPRFHNIFHIEIGIGLLLLILLPFMSFRALNQVIDILAGIVLVTAFLTGLAGAIARYRPAMHFFVGFGIVVVGGFFSLLHSMGYLPANIVTRNLLQVTQALEVIFVGFALADKYNLVKSESRLAKQEVVAHKERIQAMRQELTLASRLHARLLSSKLPSIATVRYLPSAVIGGDLFHVEQISANKNDSGNEIDHNNADTNKIRLLMADVAGHGLPAALEASMLYIAYREAKKDSPAETFRHLNNILLPVLPDLFVTAYVAEIHNHQLKCASAGHPHCLILDRKTKTVIRPPLQGKPIGIGNHWNETIIDLKEDDRILVFTDGLFETTSPDNHTQFGIERIHQELIRSSQMSLQNAADRLLTSFVIFAQTEPDDDVTFLMIDPFSKET